MKKSTLFTAAAVLALAGPLAMTTASAQGAERGQYQGQYQQDQRADRGDDDRRDRREAWRDDRRDARWDDARHNGYYNGNRWTYGPPPANRRGRFVLGYHPWERGQMLGYYNGRFQQVDYRRSNLRAPPRGYFWVTDGRGDYLLVSRGGRIMQVIASNSDHRDRRQAWRDERRDARWDANRHNGYYRNSQWTYGPPNGNFRNDEITYGYQPWERGQRLGYYDGRFQEVDYRSNRNLRAPPRGYHWVRSDGGDYLLAAIIGGLITAVIINNTQ